MMNWLADRLIARAKKTPYFHLDGYMNRWWLVPYTGGKKVVIPRPGQAPQEYTPPAPAKWYRQPFTWLCQKFDIAIRVHEILRSDEDGHLHDHPWDYLTIILKSGYCEVTPDPEGGRRLDWYGPGSVLFRRAKSRHRLVMTQPATTLFITFKYKQKWGFYVDGEKIPYDVYLRSKA